MCKDIEKPNKYPVYFQPVDEMKRITKEELEENFDEILETIEKEHIGYVIKDSAGNNDIVMCPAWWFNYCFDEDFGVILNSALCYAIGRHSYIPGVVRDFIRKYINVLDKRTLTVAIYDIDTVLEPSHNTSFEPSPEQSPDEELRIGKLDDAEEWRILRNELQNRLNEIEAQLNGQPEPD